MTSGRGVWPKPESHTHNDTQHRNDTDHLVENESNYQDFKEILDLAISKLELQDFDSCLIWN